MMRDGIPKRRASMSQTTRGKSNVDTRLGVEIEGGRQSEADAMECKDVAKMASVEGQRCGVKSSQFKIYSLLNWKPLKNNYS